MISDTLTDIKFLRLDNKNFNVNSLDGFILNQRVTACWRKVNNTYNLLPADYTEQWNPAARRQVAAKIISAVDSGAVAHAAAFKGKIIGFALIDNNLFGSRNQYADLSEFYVSEPFRRRGIGKILFDEACLAAKELGARKLYISAHSAEESIAAYKKYGCVPAEEPNGKHMEKEPCDLQLEFDLSARIYKVGDKEKYIDLLLLADEQRDMVDRYLPHGTMYVIDDCGVKGEITVIDAGNGVLEIKNLAVLPRYQRCGYGRKLIEFVCEKYKEGFSAIQVGTGDSPLTLPFYKKCGFTYSHTVKNFFIENYDHPIIEAGTQLIDMVCLSKKL